MNNEITEIIGDLKEAREYLEEINSDYADEPELLDFYSSSIKKIIHELEQNLADLLSKETGSTFHPNSDSQPIDVWIKIEGDQFQKGTGPIGVVGSFLHKLNVANQHAVSLIENHKHTVGRFNKKISNAAMFDLVKTATGSLKLGLRKPDITSHLLEIEGLGSDQQELFPVDPWEKLKKLSKENDKALQGFRLLMKAIASVENENVLNEIREKLDEKKVIKLIHYAKDLAPSTQSNIDHITFVGKDIGLPDGSLKTNKDTRMLLTEHAKKLKQDTEYITGKGVIRALDLDTRTLTSRPLLIGKRDITEIECRLSPDTSTDEMQKFIDQPVEISGFLVFNSRNQPLRLEVDEIAIDSDIEII